MKRNLLVLCQCVALVFFCEAQGSLGGLVEDEAERPPSLKFLATARALNIPQKDLSGICDALRGVRPDNFLPVVQALAPLVEGFEEGSLNALYIGFMLEGLGKVNPADVPLYVRFLRTLVPNPKKASATRELLCSFLEQGSVATAKELVKKAGDLRAFFTGERDFQHIFEYLVDVPSEKRAAVVDAVVPFVKGFEEHYMKALHTGWMIEGLGNVDLENIPGYMTILRTLVPTPKNAEATQNLLSILLQQGSVAAAKELVKEAEELTSLFETELDFQHIFEYLAKVPSEKRAAVVKAVVPLVKEFNRNLHTAEYTGLIVRRLGEVVLE